MKLSKKIVSLAAATALVAGAGALAATPVSAAKAKVKVKTSGSSVLGVPPSLTEALAGAGITLGVAGAAKAAVDGSTGYTNVTFPVGTKPRTDGVIPHKGDLTITSAGTAVTLVYGSPWIEYPTDGSEGAVLSGIISGLPDWMEPFSSALNGTRRATFNIDDWSGSWKKGKIRKVGKSYKRVDTFTGGGTVSVTTDQDSVNILNTALAGPGGSLLSPGQEIGDITTTYKNSYTCTTKKGCK